MLTKIIYTLQNNHKDNENNKFKKFSEAKQAMNQLNGSTFAGHSINITMAYSVPSTHKTKTISQFVNPPQLEHLHDQQDKQTIPNQTEYPHRAGVPPLVTQWEQATSQDDSITKHLSVEARLQAFNDNTWEVLSMENITVHPYN